MREDDRRKDARQKIQLGGLVVKAGLRETDKAIILGILKDAGSRLADKGERDRYRAIGKAAFKDDDETGNDAPDPDHAHAARGIGTDGQ
jgi:hypothetical protein